MYQSTSNGRVLLRAMLITFVALLLISVPVFAQNATEERTPEMNTLPNIVLVHGAFADGSSWSGVIPQLQAKGYNVIAPQFPLTSVQADVDRLRNVLVTLSGPTIVVGHSYGGEIMTSLGTDAL